MAEPTEFDGMNTVYGKPHSMTDDECGSLPVLQTDDMVISCWKLTDEELKNIQKTGVVWVGIMGHQVFPFYLSGKQPFELTTTPKKKERKNESNH